MIEIPHNMAPAETLAATDDSPPQSICLSKDAELGWLSSNAFYQRKDSAKPTSNSNNTSSTVIANSMSITSYALRSNSCPADFTAKASIIGFLKLGGRWPADSKKNRRNTGGASLFPRSDQHASVDPCSPRVSCVGRVQSRRAQYGIGQDGPLAGSTSRAGTLVLRLRHMFLSSCKEQQAVDVVQSEDASECVGSVAELRHGKNWPVLEPADGRNGPPGLGRMKQFASGRRSRVRGQQGVS